ncbi:hypothetical protein CC80DRAFT_598320 [Byssothecium circinans]|uniref:Uncharacterized protein n=1 Tax=Byssothecium circinans TaxID=147558 RepID=A0A6A5TC07_9PLEO|nr:hypothetical protein CC80DRAFT_598320 [Byssothecium circinans]
MHASVVLLTASVGLAAARLQPYMMYDVVSAAAANNSTRPSNTTSPSTTPAPTAPNTPGLAEPCAVVSSAVKAIPSGTRKVIPAELGVQCLQSVPLDKEGNVQLIDELKIYLQWQSNLGFLKNPPAEYTEQPVDLIEEMDSMQKQIKMGGYSNEYDFQLDLNQLFNRAYDNHLSWQPDILAGVMQFQRPTGWELVSVSADGNALPEIYSYRDLELARNTSGAFKPSPVRTINGEAVNAFLQKVSVQAAFKDANTRWNALFPSQPLIATGVNYLGSFRTGTYQGPNTTTSLANGTSKSSMNLAIISNDFVGVGSGPALFSKYCSGPTPTAPPSNSSTSSRPAATPSHAGYPKAVIINPNLSVAGYHLNDTGYTDLAILSIPSYDSPDVQRFQNVMRDFIRMSKAAGKTKLIFDLRGNGGGNAILGYDSFKQVFPQADQEPFGGTRYRINEAMKIAGQVTGDFNKKTYLQNNQTAFAETFTGTSENDIFMYTIGFNYQHQLDVRNEKINTVDQMYGPDRINGDEASYTYFGFSVIGFLNNTNETSTPQPFKAQDMVMLHDGMCSSTCSIVSELLKNQGGVRTIAVGGQPEFKPMQGVSGIKGAQNFAWDDVQVRSQIIYLLGSPEQQAEWNKTDLGKTAFATQMFKRSAHTANGPAGGINLRDNLRMNDASKTPLEFIYEAADCRMFYTAPMIGDVTMVWKCVADRMFSSANGVNGTRARCVTGSEGDPSSVSGGGQANSGSVPPKPLEGPEGFTGAASHLRSISGAGWGVVVAGVVAGMVFV